MKRFVAMFVLSGLFAWPLSAVSDQLVEEAREFFADYQRLGDAYDPALGDLYSDQAVIKTRRVYPTGPERLMEFPGTRYKALVRQAMPLAKAQGDRSTFEDVRFEVEGETVRIRARRYSERKCYWDNGYYMIVARDEAGDLRIVEEYTETQPNSNCE